MNNFNNYNQNNMQNGQNGQNGQPRKPRKYFNLGKGYIKHNPKSNKQYFEMYANREPNNNYKKEVVTLQAVDAAGNVIPISKFFIHLNDNGGQPTENGFTVPDLSCSFYVELGN